jgi:hypothetical protein
MSDSHSDPLIRDKKELALSGSRAIPQFLLFAGVITPLWLSVLLPSAIASQAVSFVWGKVTGRSGRKEAHATKQNDAKKVLGKASDKSKRKYDVIVFGATGFTGKMSSRKYGLIFNKRSLLPYSQICAGQSWDKKMSTVCTEWDKCAMR